MMHNIHAEYNWYLQRLRSDAFAANFAEQGALQDTIEEFAGIVEGNNVNTRNRLGEFASMMPESRAPGGINQSLVSFTVSPFDLTPLTLRDEIPTENLLFIEPVSETYRRHQHIAIIIAGTVFAVTLGGSLVSYFWKKRETSEKA